MSVLRYEDFLRSRITELRLKKNVSEHKMSLDLDKSGSYIRSITNGLALPSVRELFHIMEYFEITPTEFFAPLDQEDTALTKLCGRLRLLSEEELEKVAIFVGWMGTEEK